MPRLHPLTRIVLALAVLAMIAAFYLPLWEIQLWAPQYPEGLNMKIWINTLTGAFDIINGLNHYIGMEMIKVEMFPEFGYMIYLLGGLIALGLVPALTGSRKWLWTYVIVLALGGMAGLADFYAWGYKYGHNLNPNAAIQVPGMSYQPPLFGYKNLLNFTAYSGPDYGGWILIASGCIAALLLAVEFFLRKGGAPLVKEKSDARVAAIAAAAVALFFSLAGCRAGAEPIRYGHDECASCNMTISDTRYGAEIITKKGRVLKFDDIRCMVRYTKDGGFPEAEVKERLVCDFERGGSFLPVESARFLRSNDLKSPMSGHCAAFSSEAALQKIRKELGSGEIAAWEEIRKLF